MCVYIHIYIYIYISYDMFNMVIHPPDLSAACRDTVVCEQHIPFT